jgi:hypothetical protein
MKCIGTKGDGKGLEFKLNVWLGKPIKNLIWVPSTLFKLVEKLAKIFKTFVLLFEMLGLDV